MFEQLSPEGPWAIKQIKDYGFMNADECLCYYFLEPEGPKAGLSVTCSTPENYYTVPVLYYRTTNSTVPPSMYQNLDFALANTEGYLVRCGHEWKEIDQLLHTYVNRGIVRGHLVDPYPGFLLREAFSEFLHRPRIQKICADFFGGDFTVDASYYNGDCFYHPEDTVRFSDSLSMYVDIWCCGGGCTAQLFTPKKFTMDNLKDVENILESGAVEDTFTLAFGKYKKGDSGSN